MDNIDIPGQGTFYGALVHDTAMDRYVFYHRIAKDERIISKRELNILSMYTKGLTTEEIGKYLNISCGTALSHVHHASKN